MAKDNQNTIIENMQTLFMENFDKGPDLKLVHFHSFLCPVTNAEAMVMEHLVEDYDSLELLVLRLYMAGFRKAETIASLSGMNHHMIERALNNEFNVYHHIDAETGEVTDYGKQTLDENSVGNAISHGLYKTPRRFQIDAVTGTVVPSYLQEYNVKYLRQILRDDVDGILPKEYVTFDEKLRKEINERLSEYKHKDIINQGDTIIGVESVRPTQLYYRVAYLAKFEGMKYPMIVMNGRKTIDNLNADSIKKGDYNNKKLVAVPLAISETDAKYLKEYGIEFEEVLVRDDEHFEYLLTASAEFDYTSEQKNIEIEDENAVFEDEKVAEAEVQKDVPDKEEILAQQGDSRDEASEDDDEDTDEDFEDEDEYEEDEDEYEEYDEYDEYEDDEDEDDYYFNSTY